MWKIICSRRSQPDPASRVSLQIPIGKPCVTITSISGLPSTTADGTHIQLKSEGGVVDLDDWRGAEIFLPPAGQVGEWGWEWNEDDGESHLSGLKVSCRALSSPSITHSH